MCNVYYTVFYFEGEIKYCLETNFTLTHQIPIAADEDKLPLYIDFFYNAICYFAVPTLSNPWSPTKIV